MNEVHLNGEILLNTLYILLGREGWNIIWLIL
jgi:hypothetical protein